MTSGTIACPRCGERLPEGLSRCDACGAYLVSHPVAAPGAGRPGAPSSPSRHAGARRGAAGAPAWLFLLIGLVVGGAVGYALHGAVGPREDGGAPMGPSDVMSGAGSAPGGPPAGAQMPPEVTAQVQRYRAALAADPTDVQANIGLGNLLFDSGQWDRAIEHYTKALEKDPKNADVRVDRAIAYHSSGQDPKAKEEMLRVTREHPDHRNAWLNLGVVSAGMGDRATAIRAWEQYLVLDPGGQHAAAIKEELARLRAGS